MKNISDCGIINFLTKTTTIFLLGFHSYVYCYTPVLLYYNGKSTILMLRRISKFNQLLHITLDTKIFVYMNSCQLWKRVNAAGNLPESTIQMSLYNVYGFIFVTCVSNKSIKISIYLSHAIKYIFDSHRWYTNQL